MHVRLLIFISHAESGYITLLGTGGRTVEKVVKYDLQSAHKYKPDIVILELGTNDLSTHAPEVVGSKIDDHMHALRHTYTTFGLLGCARL
jgi:lysophospholipase L1-like esterase